MQNHTTAPDSSVLFTLNALADLESERVREQERLRERARAEAERARRDGRHAELEAEATRIAAEEAERVRRERAEAEERARLAGRQRAEVEVARIEAEAKVRLEAEAAQRAHELALLQARQAGGSRRLTWGLAAGLVVAVAGGAVAGIAMQHELSSASATVAALRAHETSVEREVTQAAKSELAAYDRLHTMLRARLVALGELARGADAAVGTVDDARRLVNPEAPQAAAMEPLARETERLRDRVADLERLRALDARHADLVAWGAEKRLEAAVADKVAEARATAHETASASGLASYEKALDDLREALASAAAAPTTPGRLRGPGTVTTPVTGPTCKNPHDPLCGLDGARLGT